MRRRGNGLRILFSRKGHTQPGPGRGLPDLEGPDDLQPGPAARLFKGRSRSFNWSGRGSKGKRLSNGVYYVRFRTLDANKRLDSRRVVVERKNGRFAKKAGFYLVDRCP